MRHLKPLGLNLASAAQGRTLPPMDLLSFGDARACDRIRRSCSATVAVHVPSGLYSIYCFLKEYGISVQLCLEVVQYTIWRALVI